MGYPLRFGQSFFRLFQYLKLMFYLCCSLFLK